MQIDLDYLRRHYASLSNEAFRAVNRSELVEAAQRCYDEEVARRQADRGVAAEATEAAEPEEIAGEDDAESGDGDDADWIEDAACVGTFDAYPGNDAPAEADTARQVLREAGVPCRISVEDIPAPHAGARPYTEYRVLVPGARALEGASILDRDLFNERIESDWRTHLEALADEDLRALDPDLICAGLLDRAERLRRVYEEEIARRR